MPRPPVVDASWVDGNFQLTVDLPGTPEDAITVDVAGRTLHLAVNTDSLQWTRSIRLGAALDPEQVSARYVHGRLTVTVGAAATAPTASGGVGDCVTTGVTWNNRTLSSGNAVPANGSATLTLPGAVSMNNVSETGCQGAVFTIPVTVTVVSG